MDGVTYGRGELVEVEVEVRFGEDFPQEMAAEFDADLRKALEGVIADWGERLRECLDSGGVILPIRGPDDDGPRPAA